MLVAIDDAQWIDAASAGALCFAVRRLHADRVCVLVATRPEADTGTSWSRLLHAGDRVERIRLGGLDGREVGRLAGSLGHAGLTGAAAERLRAHTGGHPLYVRALLAELPPDALTTRSRHASGPAVVRRDGPRPPRGRRAGDGGAHRRGRGRRAALHARARGRRRRARRSAARARRGARGRPARARARPRPGRDRVPAPAPARRRLRRPLPDAPPRPPPRVRAPHGAARRRSCTACPRARAPTTPSPPSWWTPARPRSSRGRLRAAVELLLLASRVAGDVDVREGALLRAVDCLGVAGDVPRAQSLRDEVAACRESPRRSFVLATLTASAGRLAEALAALTEVTERAGLRRASRAARARRLLARHRLRLRREGGGGDPVGGARARRRSALADRARHRAAGARARARDHGSGRGRRSRTSATCRRRTSCPSRSRPS